MDKLKSRPIFVSILIGALSLYSAGLLFDNAKLLKEKRNLIKEAEGLQQALTSIQSQYHALLSGMENGSQENQSLKSTIESLKKQSESLTFQIQKTDSQISSVKEEKTYLEEMLINKTKQVELLKNQSKAPENNSTVEQAPQDIQGAIQGKEDELKKLNEQNHILQEKLDRLYKTTNDKIHEINVAKIALSETVSTAQKNIEEEWNTVNLGAVTTSAMPNPTPEKSARDPKAEGHVLAINSEHGFVVIDLGKIDNLSGDATLEVKKNGVSIATLSVLEIRDVMAACNIKDIQNGQRIEINDPVSILR